MRLEIPLYWMTLRKRTCGTCTDDKDSDARQKIVKIYKALEIDTLEGLKMPVKMKKSALRVRQKQENISKQSMILTRRRYDKPILRFRDI